jgi:hypothetical protein
MSVCASRTAKAIVLTSRNLVQFDKKRPSGLFLSYNLLMVRSNRNSAVTFMKLDMTKGGSMLGLDGY